MLLFFYCWAALATAGGLGWMIAHCDCGILTFAEELGLTVHQTYAALILAILLWPLTMIVFFTLLAIPDRDSEK